MTTGIIFLTCVWVLVFLLAFFLRFERLFDEDEERRASVESQKYFLKVSVKKIEEEKHG